MNDNNNRPLYLTDYYYERLAASQACECRFDEDNYCAQCEALRLADKTELDQRMASIAGKMPETLSKPEVDFIKWMQIPSL